MNSTVVFNGVGSVRHGRRESRTSAALHSEQNLLDWGSSAEQDGRDVMAGRFYHCLCRLSFCVRKNVALIGHSRSHSDQSSPARDESANKYGFHAHVWSPRLGSFFGACHARRVLETIRIVVNRAPTPQKRTCPASLPRTLRSRPLCRKSGHARSLDSGHGTARLLHRLAVVAASPQLTKCQNTNH